MSESQINKGINDLNFSCPAVSYILTIISRLLYFVYFDKKSNPILGSYSSFSLLKKRFIIFDFSAS